ncbi:MAG: GIY-YIG nuclease family protein [Desulfurococcales archaeon]|nr:GIY-YIG nuclease family protein [Desulfurococcales archaeon]
MGSTGYYILLLCIGEQLTVEYGGRRATLPQGLYAYIGSALNSLEARIRRHLTPVKKVRWHIDRLTTSPHASPLQILACRTRARGLEPCIASKLAAKGYSGPPRFGSTDNPSSPTHLFMLSSSCSTSQQGLRDAAEALEYCCGEAYMIPWIYSVEPGPVR